MHGRAGRLAGWAGGFRTGPEVGQRASRLHQAEPQWAEQNVIFPAIAGATLMDPLPPIRPLAPVRACLPRAAPQALSKDPQRTGPVSKAEVARALGMPLARLHSYLRLARTPRVVSVDRGDYGSGSLAAQHGEVRGRRERGRGEGPGPGPFCVRGWVGDQHTRAAQWGEAHSRADLGEQLLLAARRPAWALPAWSAGVLPALGGCAVCE